MQTWRTADIHREECMRLLQPPKRQLSLHTCQHDNIAVTIQYRYTQLCKHNRTIIMYKSTQGLVAVPSSYLTPADSRTRTNHIYKFRNISASSSAYTRIHSFLEQFRSGTIYTRTLLKRHLWAASRIVWGHSPSLCRPTLCWRDIPPGVCQLRSRTRTITIYSASFSIDFGLRNLVSMSRESYRFVARVTGKAAKWNLS